MLFRWPLRLVRDDVADDVGDCFVERRAAARRQVFREAILALEEYYRIRVIVTDLSPCGAGIAFSDRIELPSRVLLVEPTMKLKYWSRVAWQTDGAAGLEFLERR